MQTRRTSAPTMVQALVRFLVWAGVLFWIVFYGGLGWVFSDTIKQDALDISPYVQERDVEVTAATSETVALIAEVGSNARDEGWFGINWDGGNGLVGPIVERIADTVVGALPEWQTPFSEYLPKPAEVARTVILRVAPSASRSIAPATVTTPVLESIAKRPPSLS